MLAVRILAACALLAAASAFTTGPMGVRPTQLRSSAFCPAQQMARAPVAQQGKAVVTMGLESITDTSSFGLLKWFGFFGATFVPSFFLAAYFLGGYYPPLATGANTEPDWWPTAMQYDHGVPKGVLAKNSAIVEAKEKAAEEAKQKAEAAKKAAKKAAKEAAKKAAADKAAAEAAPQ